MNREPITEARLKVLRAYCESYPHSEECATAKQLIEEYTERMTANKATEVTPKSGSGTSFVESKKQ